MSARPPSLPAKLSCAAVIALLCASLPDAPAASPTPMRAAHGGNCGDCHREIHEEWRTSAHGTAFADVDFQAALASRRNPERCVGCHAPASVPDRLGRMPHARADDRASGITCASCHRRGNTILGPFGSSTEAHASAQDPAFTRQGSDALCKGCHDLRIADVLPLAREFAASDLAVDGRSCVGCHMPSVQRALAVDPVTGRASDPIRHGRSHALLGPDDPTFCAKAFEFRVSEASDGVVVHVVNTAGHGVPGLARHRAFVLTFDLLDRAGGSLHQQRMRLDGDNRLLVEEDREVRLRRPAGASRLRIRVDHAHRGKPPATVVDQELALP